MSPLTAKRMNTALTNSAPASPVPAEMSLKRSRPSSSASASSSEEDRKREKLLFLLEVACGASSAEATASGNRAEAAEQQASAEAPDAATASKDEEDEEEARRKKRRVDYALSVLNGGREENAKILATAVEEAKKKRARAAMASLTGRPWLALEPSPASGSKNRGFKAGKKGGKAGGIAASGSASAPPKRRHVRKRTFAEKLMDVLSNPSCSHAVSWLPAGDSFVVVSPKSFVADVLPQYFKTAKFESFTRKLNRWGFKRISRPGTHAVAYRHELFRRDAPELCKKMSGGRREEEEAQAMVQHQHPQQEEELQELLQPCTLGEAEQEAQPPPAAGASDVAAPNTVPSSAVKSVDPQPRQQTGGLFEAVPSEALAMPSKAVADTLKAAATSAGPGASLRMEHLSNLAKLTPREFQPSRPACGMSSARTSTPTRGLHGMLSRLGAPVGANHYPSLPSTIGGAGSFSKLAQSLKAGSRIQRAAGISGDRPSAGDAGGEDHIHDTLRRAARVIAGEHAQQQRPSSLVANDDPTKRLAGLLERASAHSRRAGAAGVAPRDLPGAASAGSGANALDGYYNRRMAEIAALYSSDKDKDILPGVSELTAGKQSYLRRIRQNLQEKVQDRRQQTPPRSQDRVMPPKEANLSASKEQDLRLLRHLQMSSSTGGSGAFEVQQHLQAQQLALMRARHAQRMATLSAARSAFPSSA